MYTVLIQSKNTMESFLRFYPLLTDTVDAGDLGVCQWIPSGNTVETALPGLIDRIEKKAAWRAIILQTELDGTDEQNPCAPDNPYDFLENRDRTGLTIENGEIVDCRSPLIRLTHMLGGMPTPEHRFEEYVHYSEDEIPHFEYRKIDDVVDGVSPMEAHRRWSETHIMDALPPQEIILITARSRQYVEDPFSQIDSLWKPITEAQSSAFWKRNLYPHNCRFLVFNLDRHGEVRAQRDYFKLWTAILLIATNPSDPDTLQAHRLYKLDIAINREKLRTRLQESVDELNKASYILRGSLAKDEKKDHEENPEIPDYKIGVPVSFSLPSLSKLQFDTSRFPLAGESGEAEQAIWDTYQKEAGEELRILIRSADRFLDHAAERLRLQIQYTEGEVYQLTPYQEEDLQADLNVVYSGILKEQSQLPGEMSETKERAEAASEEVKDRLRSRVVAGDAAKAVILPLCLLLVSLASGLLDSSRPIWLPISVGAAAVLLILATVCILAIQRRNLLKYVRKFQMILQAAANELTQNSGVFSRFLSNISSHIHGRSFLDAMHEKQERHDSSYYFKLKHIKAIELFMDKIGLWSIALQAEVDMHSSHAIQNYDDEPDIDYDGLYSLQSGKSCAVPLNHSGVSFKAPFDFVDSLEIEREEVYDDA